MERAVFDILTSCKGNDLTELKAIMDSKGNYHSLHKLVFNDIKTTSNRKLIADHMLEEARRIHQTTKPAGQKNAIYRSKSLLMSSTPPIPDQDPYVFSDPTVANSRLLIQAKTKIISDYDDTIECSGGLYPAGCDRRYERHVAYPGVGAFYREIDLCGSGDVVSALVARGWPLEGEDGGITRLGNLAVISARPRGLAEHSAYSKFAALQKKGILHCTPTLLPGSLMGGKEFVLRDRLEPLAENKFANFREYATLYPEFEYVFVGDNGQADVRAVAMMMQLPYIKFRAAFVHVVQPISLTYGMPKDVSKFCFFTNYVQAALYAYQHAIISASSLARVTIDAVERFEMVKNFTSHKQDHSPRAESSAASTDVAAAVSKSDQNKTETLRIEINLFVDQVVKILRKDLANAEIASIYWSHEMVSTVRDLLMQIRPIDAPRYFALNARVLTKYASGEVEGFAPDIGMYTVRMHGKGGAKLKACARVFSYYTQVREDEQGTGKWPLLGLGLFGRRMSASDFGSPRGRESPKSLSGKNSAT